MFSIATFAALLAASTTAVHAQSSVAQLVGQLRQAPTEVDRLRLLSDDDLVFDFLNPGPVGTTSGAGGHTVEASSNNFPAVVGQGVSMTIGFLGPCGMNSPHTHPRATEINFSLNTTLRGGVLLENGARFSEVDIRPGTATVFPQGAIHFEMNPSCEPAMFVAAFNGEDPGVGQVAQRFFGLPPDIVGAALGGLGVTEVAGLESMIPDNVILGVDECLQRCGITRGLQPTAQRQPRVSGNAFPNSTFPNATSTYPAPAETSTETASYSYTPVSSSVYASATASVKSDAPAESSSYAAPAYSSYAAQSASTYSAVAPTYTSAAAASSYYSSYAPAPTYTYSAPADSESASVPCETPAPSKSSSQPESGSEEGGFTTTYSWTAQYVKPSATGSSGEVIIIATPIEGETSD